MPYEKREFQVPKTSQKYVEIADYKDPSSFEQTFGPDILLKVPTGEKTDWNIIQKAAQHAKHYDLMIMQGGLEMISTVGELSEKEGRVLFHLSADVAEEIYQKPDSELVLIDWNTSPEEYLRRNPQTVKRIHIHTTGITQQEFKDNFRKIETEELSEKEKLETKKALYEPFLKIFCEIMNQEIVEQVNGLEGVFVLGSQESKINSFPAGFQMELKNGLNTLHQEDFFPVIQRIHRFLSEKYKTYSELFISDEFDENDRPKLLPREEIFKKIEDFLEKEQSSDYVKNFLRRLARIIKDAHEIPKSEWFIKGLSYTSAIYSDKKEGNGWRLIIAPRIVCGGGALEIFGIKLNRTPNLQFSEEDLEKQRDFKKGVANNLLKKYGSKAKKGLALESIEK